ncbi:MAG: endonuclease [Chloroflexia bacterium]|nr:endonuclease [Chloroflexia bacterium]
MVYLLHFDAPISDKHTTRHYLGYAGNLKQRLDEHATGFGARLTQVALERGITWRCVRTWDGDRQLERKMKNWKNGPKLCPLCNAQAQEGKG